MGAVAQKVASVVDIPALTTLANVAKQGDEQLYKPAANFVGALNNGKSLGQAVGAGIKPTKDQVGGMVSDAKGKPEAINIGAPADPVQVQADNEKEKARAKRQSEIDILTDRPGRGGTILTDKYNYQV